MTAAFNKDAASMIQISTRMSGINEKMAEQLKERQDILKELGY
jgi:hypothetical protein